MLLHLIISLYLAAVSMAENVTRFERESGLYPQTPDSTTLTSSEITCSLRCTSEEDWLCGGFRHLPDGTCRLYKESSLNPAGSSGDSATEESSIYRRKSCPDQCTCPEGFQRRADHCLYWRELLHQNYTDAEAACANSGGLLFAPRNDKENQAVVDLAGNARYVWLGYRTRSAENLTISSDGRPATYTNWYPGEPNMEEDGCVWSYQGLWYVTTCIYDRYQLCYLPQCFRPGCLDEQ